MTALRQASATAIEALRSEAVAREVEIRKEATRAAELSRRRAHHRDRSRAPGIRIRGSAGRVEQAEANRIAAEQTGATKTSQLDKSGKDERYRGGEIERGRGCRRSCASVKSPQEEAGTRFRDALKANENAVAEANAKLREADGKVVALTEQHASAIGTKSECSARDSGEGQGGCGQHRESEGIRRESEALRQSERSAARTRKENRRRTWRRRRD